jgi:outer membrane receptor protein involved in Fe transport
MTNPIAYRNSQSPLATVGLEGLLRREWAQGWMAEAGYTLQTAQFLASESTSDFFSWKASEDQNDVANVPNHLVTAKAAVPIIGKALTLGSRITAESSRKTGEELTSDGAQDSTNPFFIWDVVLSGREAGSGVSYSFGVYNVTSNQYSLPVSAELTQSTFIQPGRTFLAQLGIVL